MEKTPVIWDLGHMIVTSRFNVVAPLSRICPAPALRRASAGACRNQSSNFEAGEEKKLK
jgi:hypothetical protein